MPDRPLPKIFRLTKGGSLNEGIFRGSTINTPSMLCVADYLDTLDWARSLGGVPALVKRCEDNLAVIERFVAERDWIDFLAKTPQTRSSTSVLRPASQSSFAAHPPLIPEPMTMAS